MAKRKVAKLKIKSPFDGQMYPVGAGLSRHWASKEGLSKTQVSSTQWQQMPEKLRTDLTTEFNATGKMTLPPEFATATPSKAKPGRRTMAKAARLPAQVSDPDLKYTNLFANTVGLEKWVEQNKQKIVDLIKITNKGIGVLIADGKPAPKFALPEILSFEPALQSRTAVA